MRSASILVITVPLSQLERKGLQGKEPLTSRLPPSALRFFNPTARKNKYHGWRCSLFQMLREKLRRAVPGRLGALGVIVLSRLIEEGMAGIVPVGFEGHFAFPQLGL